MKRVIGFMLMAFMLTSCYVFETSLTVDNELTAYAFVEGQTEPNHLNEITISAGNYSGQFISTSATHLDFHSEIDGIKFYIPVNLPTTDFDGQNGKFEVSAERAGQPWGYEGQLVRTHQDSDSIHAVEECGYIVYHQVCRRVPNSDGSYNTVCRDEGHIKDGTQEVDYIDRHINEHFKAIIKSKRGEEFGTFEGDRKTVRKIYSFRGVCS